MGEEKIEESSYLCSLDSSRVQFRDIISTTLWFSLQICRWFKYTMKLLTKANFLIFVPLNRVWDNLTKISFYPDSLEASPVQLPDIILLYYRFVLQRRTQFKLNTNFVMTASLIIFVPLKRVIRENMKSVFTGVHWRPPMSNSVTSSYHLTAFHCKSADSSN